MSTASKPPTYSPSLTYRGEGPMRIELAETGGIAVGGEHADHGADGVADEDDVVDIERLEDLQEIVGVAVERVVLSAPVGRRVGASRAHVVEQDDLEVGLERRCDRSSRWLDCTRIRARTPWRGHRGCPSP